MYIRTVRTADETKICFTCFLTEKKKKIKEKERRAQQINRRNDDEEMMSVPLASIDSHALTLLFIYFHPSISLPFEISNQRRLTKDVYIWWSNKKSEEVEKLTCQSPTLCFVVVWVAHTADWFCGLFNSTRFILILNRYSCFSSICYLYIYTPLSTSPLLHCSCCFFQFQLNIECVRDQSEIHHGIDFFVTNAKMRSV